MKLVVQRVSRASITVEDRLIGKIDMGLMVLLGIHRNDTYEMVQFLSDKLLNLRIFGDDMGKMNRSVLDVEGNILLISQFTLYGDCRKGRRPSYIEAADSKKGEELYEKFLKELRKTIPEVQAGSFGAHMKVDLLNDGPVTLILEK